MASREALLGEDRLGPAEGSQKHKHHRRFVIKPKELPIDAASYDDDEDEDVDIEDDVRRTFVVRNPCYWHASCMMSAGLHGGPVFSLFYD